VFDGLPQPALWQDYADGLLSKSQL